MIDIIIINKIEIGEKEIEVERQKTNYPLLKRDQTHRPDPTQTASALLTRP